MAIESPISRRRRCTDVPCLLLFVGFLIGWVVVAGIAMSQGSIKHFSMPTDSNDNICGVDKGFEKKPYLMFFDLIKCASSKTLFYGCPTPQMCVEKCPSSYFFGAVPALLTQAKLHPLIETKLKASLNYCLPGVNRTELPYARLVDGYHCASWYVKSNPVAGRCLPGDITKSVSKMRQLSRQMHEGLAGTEARSISQASQQIQLMVAPRKNLTIGTNGTSTAAGAGAGTRHGTNTTRPTNVTLPGRPQTSEGNSITKRVLRVASEAVRQMRFIRDHLVGLTCASLATPLLLALLLLLLLRCFIWPIVVLVLTGVMVGLAVATILCARRYVQLRDAAGEAAEEDELEKDVSAMQNPRVWCALAVVAGVLLLLFVVLVIALRRRLVLAVVILEQCSVAMGDMLTLVLMPLLSFVLQLVFCLAFALVLVFLLGSSHQWRVFGPCDGCDRHATGDRCYPGEFSALCGDLCPNATCSSTQDLTLYAYNGFGLIWGICFVKAVNQIAVAIAFTTWYFSSNKRLSLLLPLLAFGKALLYHSGTAVFGSLLIAIVKVIRGILTAIRARLEKRAGFLAGCLITCCMCCFWCLEHVVQFINRRAYIVTALESVGLCTAGRRGVTVVARNLARVAVADSVTALVLWLGRLLVVVASVLFCHWLLAASLAEPVPWLLPAVYTAVIGYVVAGTTFSVYSMGVDSIFYCAMVDLDENDGSAGKPYAMSRSLAKALGVADGPPPGAGAGAEAGTAPAILPPIPPPPVSRAPSDFWAQQQPPPPMQGQFVHPGMVERPFTPVTPLPNNPRYSR